MQQKLSKNGMLLPVFYWLLQLRGYRYNTTAMIPFVLAFTAPMCFVAFSVGNLFLGLFLAVACGLATWLLFSIASESLEDFVLEHYPQVITLFGEDLGPADHWVYVGKKQHRRADVYLAVPASSLVDFEKYLSDSFKRSQLPHQVIISTSEHFMKEMRTSKDLSWYEKDSFARYLLPTDVMYLIIQDYLDAEEIKQHHKTLWPTKVKNR